MDETLGGYLCGALFAVAGVVQLLFGLRILRKAKQSLSWPTVSGVVLGSGVEHPSGRSSRRSVYAMQVQYDYNVDGKGYASARVAFGGSRSYGDPADLEPVLAKYAKGNSVKVYYDPTNPAVSVLEPGEAGNGRLLVWLGLAFVLMGLLSLTLIACLAEAP